jgi:hypothetical protein
MKTYHPKSVDEAIDQLHQFFEVDMWYAKTCEWKTEKDMLKYLKAHFGILKKEIRRLKK